MANVRPATLSKPQKNAARNKLVFDVPLFGTLDTTSDPSLMNPEDSPDCLNVNYDQVQSVMTRKGYSKLLTTKTPSFIGGMYPFYQSTGLRQLVYASGQNLYYYNNAGGSTQISGIPASFSANKQWDFDEYMDSVYGGNGVDGLVAYNGNNYTFANSAIAPQFIKIHKNRVFCANLNSSTLYFSDAGDPTSFPANNFIQINTQDGQNITGIDVIQDNVIIFKDESVWILSGEPIGSGNLTTIGNLQLRQANGAVGCSAFRTIQHVDDLLVFMHYSGIYYLQNYSIKPLSPQLNTTFKSSMNPNVVSQCWATYNSQEKKYLLGYPTSSSTYCNQVIYFDLLTKGFAIWDDMPGGCATSFKFSNLTENTLMGDPNVGNIYELFQGYADIAGDNGTATGGTTTTLIDTTKNWTVNQFVDCRVMIGNNLGTYITAIVQGNTSNTLTFTTSIAAPSAGTQYSIGFYTSYWKTKIFDFGATGYTKKYRFFNLFTDAETYNILFGSAIDYGTCSFQKSFSLVSNALIWGQAGIVWGQAGYTWGSYASEFGQANVAGTGRHIQVIFGNNLANQPWRAIRESFSYKLKKMRPNIVTT